MHRIQLESILHELVVSFLLSRQSLFYSAWDGLRSRADLPFVYKDAPTLASVNERVRYFPANPDGCAQGRRQPAEARMMDKLTAA